MELGHRPTKAGHMGKQKLGTRAAAEETGQKEIKRKNTSGGHSKSGKGDRRGLGIEERQLKSA